MADDRMISEAVLKQALDIIMNQRQNQHGDAENSFQMIADLWSVYITHSIRRSLPAFNAVELKISAFDVAQMMSLLKKARATYGNGSNPDHYIDDIGYASLAAMLGKAEIK